MFPVLNIGPLALHMPGLLLLCGVWLALAVIDRQAARMQIDGNWLSTTLLLALAAGLIGARIAYAVPAADAYLAEPLALIRPDLNSFNGGWGVAAAAAVIAVRFQRRSLLNLAQLAVLAPGLIILFAAAAAADLADGSRYGLITTVPWAIRLWEEQRHPTQIYRIIGAGVAFAGWLWSATRLAAAARLRLVVALLAATALISDGFLADGHTLPGGIRLSQVLAWFVLAAAWPTAKPSAAGTTAATTTPTTASDD